MCKIANKHKDDRAMITQYSHFIFALKEIADRTEQRIAHIQVPHCSTDRNTMSIKTRWPIVSARKSGKFSGTYGFNVRIPSRSTMTARSFIATAESTAAWNQYDPLCSAFVDCINCTHCVIHVENEYKWLPWDLCCARGSIWFVTSDAGS